MTFATDAQGKIEDAQAQIARLREQVEALLKERVTPAMADFAGRAESAVQSASGVMRDQAQVVSGRVKEQPLVAIMIAAAVGWVIGRVMR
ncbi:MAG: hypothetical protein QOH05_3147 [Acetobacteraceae bacterium]|jgi:ElaB/YqjD/DUF883 family membrane-anchored ribosome-binding protein|nr:hypothetical protein [Acetobacteraceae bacterium]